MPGLAVAAVLTAPVTAVLTAPTVTTVLTLLVVTTVIAVMPPSSRDNDSNRILSAIGDAGDWFFDACDEHPYVMLFVAGVCLLVPLSLFFGITLGVALSYVMGE